MKNTLTPAEVVGKRIEDFLINRFPDAGSQRKRSELFGFPNGTVDAWIKGTNYISGEGCIRLQELGCDLNQLLSPETKKSPPLAGIQRESVAKLSKLALELQDALNNIHLNALDGTITSEQFQAILAEITASMEKVMTKKKVVLKRRTTA